MTDAICGDSLDAYLGPPPPKQPTCDDGHRRILMVWRVRRQGYWCRHCGRVMTEEENIARPENAWYRERVQRLLAL